VAQTLQIKAQHQKELLRRDLDRRDMYAAEREEQYQALAPSRKRDREFRDAVSEAQHQDRMQKLAEKQDNQRRTRQCTIEKRTLRCGQTLQLKLRDAQRKKHLMDIELERRAFHKELDAEETATTNARRIATLEREAAEKLEDERFRQREEAGEFEFKLRRKAVKARYTTALYQNDVNAKNTNVSLFEKHGYSIPDELF